ncbi:MAG: molybdopterin-guanine dinucleotide biosynthesis protein B [Gammaproteobacteria bacterium]|jgi:molybdopterin-guanine dinucleotide biosynthesis adapter protein
MISCPRPIIGFAAFSGTGKTTLLKRLIPRLRKDGLNLALVKHAHHNFDVDHEGKDSHALRKAGSEQVLLASRNRYAWIRELPERHREPSLSEALQQLDMTHIDLVLVEGFKAEPFPKIELHRPALGKPLLFRSDRHIIAIATDTEHVENCPLPHLDLNDADAIAHFILQRAMQDPSPDDEGEVKDSCRSKRSFSNASAGR